MSNLFSPFKIGNLTLKNRLVISPMCNYSAHDGFINDWHMVTVGRYALGGAAMVMLEASAVQANGRITHGDLGIWKDEHIEGLKRLADFLRANDSVPAIQLGHAGRKASMARPWYGNGPLTQADFDRGDNPWPICAPSDIPVANGWMVPRQMSVDDIHTLKNDFVAAANRALKAGFDVIELHAAHGYLLHSFLSPLSNLRNDLYGGDRAGRSKLLLEIAAALRAVWPSGKPLLVRLSAIDDLDGGWEIEDSIWLAQQLKALGVDAIDCSSGGIVGGATSSPATVATSAATSAATTAAPTAATKAGLVGSVTAGPPVPRTKRVPGFQVPLAKAIKAGANIPTIAVGLILTASQAEDVVTSGDADLVAIAREALDNPNWPVHAAQALAADASFSLWPKQFGWWLNVRQGILSKLGLSSR
jgi:2,4-dienoyl-CoA reductase-like NADH-dependent reductase (Old Yellow Enzyme family)